MFRRRRTLAITGVASVAVTAALIGGVTYQAQAANPHHGRHGHSGGHPGERWGGHAQRPHPSSTPSSTPSSPPSSTEPAAPTETAETASAAPADTASAVPVDPGTAQPGSASGSQIPTGFTVSEAQFNQMFPNRNAFYTYSGLVKAISAYPAFATTGNSNAQKLEAAAFLANVSHETGGLVHTVEQNTANYSHYCDTSQSYGCPAGGSAYYGRGPIQLSWNFNYKAAGDALGIDLLGSPDLVATDPAVSWKTGLWYWNTQSGPGSMTGHEALVAGNFGESIRSINGALECNGGNPAQVQSRVDRYKEYASILGATVGGNLTC